MEISAILSNCYNTNWWSASYEAGYNIDNSLIAKSNRISKGFLTCCALMLGERNAVLWYACKQHKSSQHTRENNSTCGSTLSKCLPLQFVAVGYRGKDYNCK